MKIPPQCIRERWTKAIGQQLLQYVPDLYSADDPQCRRFIQLYNDSVNLALNSSQTVEDTRITVKRIRRAAKHVEVDPSVRSGPADMDGLSTKLRDIHDPVRLSQNLGVCNPQKRRSRGAPPKKLQKCGKCGIKQRFWQKYLAIQTRHPG